jgi:hypothetical protein
MKAWFEGVVKALLGDVAKGRYVAEDDLKAALVKGKADVAAAVAAGAPEVQAAVKSAVADLEALLLADLA